MKRRYTVVLSSDDHKSEVDVFLTKEALAVLVAFAAAVNLQAKWSVDIRMNIELPADPQGDAA